MSRAFALTLCCLALLLCLTNQTTQLYAQQLQPGGARSVPFKREQNPQRPQELKPDAEIVPPYYDYPYGSQTTMGRTLTIDEAVTLALANAATYQQALLEEQSAREDMKQARVAFLPQLSAPLSYTGTTPSQVRAPGEPLIFSFVSASAINETAAFLNATGPIDLSGRLRASLRRSRALLSATRAGALVARRQLVLDTVDAYYGLVLARQKRRLADETLALAEGYVNLAQRLQQRGESEESDVHRARSEAATRRDELEQARFAESAAMSLLRVLTGIDFSTHIGVSRLSHDVPSVADFLSYTEELINSRPELAQLEAQRQAAREDARIARRELLPELSYSLNAGFDAASLNQLRRYSGGSAIVSLNIPLWNFGASKSRAAQARLRTRSLELQRENTLRQLRQEFYTQRAAALAALSRIKIAETAASTAQQNQNSIFVRYRLNKAAITEVIDAQSNYAGTRLAYYQAIADYHAARVRLEVDPSQRAATHTALSSNGEKRTIGACSLTAAQSPVLGGLQLGMRAGQVAARFPELRIGQADELGAAQALLSRDDLAAHASLLAQWPELETINLEFMDDALTFIRFNYQRTDRWESKDQFLSIVAAKLGIKGKWTAFYDWQDKSAREPQDFRDMALECVGFRLRVGIGTEGIGADQTPHITLEDMSAARIMREREESRPRGESGEQQEKPKP